MRQAELFYPAKTLEFSRIDKAREQLSLVVVRLDPNNVVDRIAVYFFRQIARSLCKKILAKL
jgi:Iap family predicted aminopeptidase